MACAPRERRGAPARLFSQGYASEVVQEMCDGEPESIGLCYLLHATTCRRVRRLV
jgi:hypothetical protein